jgi:hypothetical protein
VKLNDEQRTPIKILWYQGVGYKKIVVSMGLSRDVVKGYVKDMGLIDLQPI